MKEYTLLQTLVYTQLGSEGHDEFTETLKDVRDHGADCGFSGFTYYTETTKFYDEHKGVIQKALIDEAYSLGLSCSNFVASFPCLRGDFSSMEIDSFLMGMDQEDQGLLKNALAWFTLEIVAGQIEE